MLTGILATVTILVIVAAAIGLSFAGANDLFTIITSPTRSSAPASGEYVPRFPEIDAITQDVLPNKGLCFRCETKPVTTPSSLYCGGCREIVAALPVEPVERGSLR